MAGFFSIGKVKVPLLSPKEIKNLKNDIKNTIDTVKGNNAEVVESQTVNPQQPQQVQAMQGQPVQGMTQNNGVQPQMVQAQQGMQAQQVQPQQPQGQPQSQAQGQAQQPQETEEKTKGSGGNLVDNTLGKAFGVVPGVFTKAAHGFSFASGIAKNDTSSFRVQKSSGEELKKELDKVQNESKDYINSADKDDKMRIERDKNKKMTSYRYKVKDSRGKIISNTFEAASVSDVRVFLQNEGYEVVEIKERSKYDIDINFNTKIKTGNLAFMLTQLSTYIKAGVPLINSVRILAKQTQNAAEKKILNKVVYELVVGEKFSVALEKQGNAFPNLLINMVKTSEMTGDLASTLDEMAAYYTETEKSRKAMKSALIYPAVILTATIAALVFIIVYVVPQFVGMFSSNGAELPAITKFVIALSDFLSANWWKLILLIILIIFIYKWLYKNVQSFRRSMQTFYMHLPVFGNIIIYNEVSTITRTFASLLNHNVFITDSMEILSKLSNNEIYKEIINRTLINLSKGGKISDSFKGEWAFPIVAYEMLVTGESTGQLALMMEKVAEHFTQLHSNSVTAIKSLIEPVVILVLAGGVGFIIMSIIVPMFDLYGQI